MGFRANSGTRLDWMDWRDWMDGSSDEIHLPAIYRRGRGCVVKSMLRADAVGELIIQ